MEEEPFHADDIELHQLLLCVIRSLVDRRADLRVIATRDQDGVVFRVLAHSSDRGKLIGRNGRTARALRVILGANAVRLGRAYRLDIVGDDPSEPLNVSGLEG